MGEEGRKPASLEDVLDAIRVPESEPRHGLHSPVYEAMWGAYDDLAPHLTPPRRPDWRRVAAKLAALGVRDGKGQPPTAEPTRKTWWKVRWDKQVVEADAPRRRRKKAAEAAPAAVPGHKPQAATPPPDDPGFEWAWGDDTK